MRTGSDTRRERSDAQDGKEAEGHGSVCLTVWVLERSDLCPGGFGGGEEVRVEQHAHLLPTKPPHASQSDTKDQQQREARATGRVQATKAQKRLTRNRNRAGPRGPHHGGEWVDASGLMPHPLELPVAVLDPKLLQQRVHPLRAVQLRVLLNPQPTCGQSLKELNERGRAQERAREGACQVRRARAAGSAEASR